MIMCPRGGIGIHSRLRACARKGVLVRVQSGALKAICSVDSTLGTKYIMRRLFLREGLSLLRAKTAPDFLGAYLSGLQKRGILANLTPTA